MSSTFQDTSRLLGHIKTEDVQHQASTNSLLNDSEQQRPGTASNLMPSTFQDTSRLLGHIKTEDTQPQASRSKGLSNEVISHSSVNTSAPCQSSTPFISNPSLTNWSLNVLNKATQSTISTPSIELTPNTPHALIPTMSSSIQNVTDQNFNAASPSITYPACKIRPEFVSPKKKYDCSGCSLSFNHKSTLKEHMRKHSSEKPNICDDCGKKFKSKGILKTHMKQHCKKQPRYTTEDMQPQASRSKRPNNEIIYHIPVNTSNAPCQSSTPSINYQSVTDRSPIGTLAPKCRHIQEALYVRTQREEQHG